MNGYRTISGLASAALWVAMTGITPLQAVAQPRVEGADTVTVVAPRVTVERGAQGISKVITAEMSVRVGTSDLDLTRISDVDELAIRVNEAAALLCKELESELPFGQPSRLICQRRAADDALAQVRRSTDVAMTP